MKVSKRKKIIAIAAVVILALAVCAYAGVRWYIERTLDDNLEREELDVAELSCVDVDGYINILLLGVDARDMSESALEYTNTDCIIVMSINTETSDINLISVYRDSYLPTGTYSYGKINSAMAIGGVDNTIRSLNESMDLNIENYALFNWMMVADLVDEVGGVTVEVSEAEMYEMNNYIEETAYNTGREDYSLITSAGEQTLDGVQAVTYGRIRKGVGDDYSRTDRMRLVLTKTMDQLKSQSVTNLLDIAKMCRQNCKTSLSNNDILGLAQRLTSYSIKGSTGFPYTRSAASLNSISYVFPTNLASDVIRLHEEMFGQENYTPSNRVYEISNTVYSTYLNSGNQNDIDFDVEEVIERKDDSDSQVIEEPSDNTPTAPDANGDSGNSDSNGDSGNSGSNGDSGSSGGNGNASGGDNTPEVPGDNTGGGGSDSGNTDNGGENSTSSEGV